MESVKLKDVQASDKYVVKAVCGDCGEPLAETHTMTGNELKKSWVMIVMGGPLVIGSCPKGCKPTFSDCNINNDLKVYPADGTEVEEKEAS